MPSSLPVTKLLTVLPTLLSPAVMGISVFMASKITRTWVSEVIKSPGWHLNFQMLAKTDAVIVKSDRKGKHPA